MTLLELLNLLQKKWYFLIVFPLLFAGATAGYSWGVLTNNYTAHVSLYILHQSESDSSSSGITSGDMTASQQLANDIAVLVKSNRVVNATAETLGMQSFDDYSLEVNSATTNRVITLSVTGKKPESVAIIANELAKQVSATAVEVMDLKAVNVVDAAEVPQEPSGPNRALYTAIAFLVGLFFAIALVVLIDKLDTTIRNSEDAENLLDLPVLGTMPIVKKGK